MNDNSSLHVKIAAQLSSDGRHTHTRLARALPCMINAMMIKMCNTVEFCSALLYRWWVAISSASADRARGYIAYGGIVMPQDLLQHVDGPRELMVRP